eukprot:2179042-Pleurochrysis_carterae.AAC.1
MAMSPERHLSPLARPAPALQVSLFIRGWLSGGVSRVRTKRSRPLRSSSHSDERFRGRQGEETSSASVPE